jgi:hypothetical protein
MRRRMHVGCLAAVLLLHVAMSCSGCATIGPAAPHLSAEIGTRTADMQAVHTEAVRRYFALERRRVEDFFNQVWLPKFLSNFVTTTDIVKTLARDPKPAELIIEWSGDAQTKIASERREFLTPVDEAEHTVLAELATAYADLSAAQSLLTARLQVAADLKDEQDRVLQRLQVDRTFANVKQQLGGVSQAVGTALSTVDDKLDDKAVAKVLGERLRAELQQILTERPVSKAPSQQP